MTKISKMSCLAIAGLAAVSVAVAILSQHRDPDKHPMTPATESTHMTQPAETHRETEPPIIEHVPEGFNIADPAFPLLMENGGLKLDMPFSFDGLNPDAGIAEGTNIAALTVTNQSGRHLAEAELILATPDGTHIRFYAQHIPDGQKCLLFSTDNLELPPQDQWLRIYYRAVFTDGASLLETGLRSEISGTQVVLTNETGESLPPFVLYCHDLLGEEYFGGKAYAYNVNTIPSGQSVTIDAANSLIGIIDAVYAGQITE